MFIIKFFKNLLKKILITYLTNRKGSFSGFLFNKEIVDIIRFELERIQLRKENLLDKTDEVWQQFESDALLELRAPGGLEHFLRLKTICKTMFEYYSPILIREYIWLKWYSHQNHFDMSYILKEDAVGDPVPFLLDSSTSGNLLHHVYHYAKYLEFNNKGLSSIKKVIEFGGGYGSMCRVLIRAGFIGKYIIIDLKTFSFLQAYFLNSIGIKAKIIPEHLPSQEIAVVECVTHYEVPNEIYIEPTLFIATWSLSEIGIDKRIQMIPIMDSSTHFLIAFRDEFEGFDNMAWFKSYILRRSDVQWQLVPISHNKNQYYLFGAVKEIR